MYQAFVDKKAIGTKAEHPKDCWELLRKLYLDATKGLDEFETTPREFSYISDAINDLEELAVDDSDTSNVLVGILLNGPYIGDDLVQKQLTVKKV